MTALDMLIQPMWEVSPYAIAVVDFDSDPLLRKFVYVNSAFTDLTGYSRDEAIGRPSTLLDGPHTDQAASLVCESSINQGKTCKTALIRYRKDGTEYASETTVAPLVETGGRPEFLIFFETKIASTTAAPLTEAGNSTGVIVPLVMPMPLQEFRLGDLPQHLQSHPALDEIAALWLKLRGKRSLPIRADFDLKTMSRWAPHLSVATVVAMGRFQFRLFGTELARVYGQDLTGRFLDELTPRDLWSVVIQHYQEVVRTRSPLFAPVSIANGRWYSEVSRLLLPLAADDDQNKVALVMGADYARTVY